MRILSLLLAFAVLTIAFGCSESGDDTTRSDSAIDAATLFGLESGRRLVYLQTDTVTNPDFSITVTTDFETVNVAGNDNDWIIRNGDSSVINLKLTDNSIIQNGHWYSTIQGDSLKYFAVPPILMHRSLSDANLWEGYTPHFFDGSQSLSMLWYYGYFGFYFTKEYEGRVQLQLPAGSFETYHFKVALYRNPIGGEPDVTVDEYFVPSIGMAQLNLRGAALNRTLSLISYQ